MIKGLYTLFGILLLALNVQGQYGFQKVYDHHEIDTISIISDIYLHNDSIYFSGGGRLGNSSGLRFGKVNNEGELTALTRHDIPNHAQRAYFSGVDTDTNFRGNLVNTYPSYDLDYGKMGFRLIEHSLAGDLIFDSLYTFLWDQDSLGLFDYSKLLQLEDSTYLVNLNYSVESESSPNTDVSGTLILKISYEGDILWEHRYFSNSSQPGRWTAMNFLQGTSNMYKLHFLNSKIFAPSSAELDWAKQHFLTLDENGNVLEHNIFQDGQYCFTFGEAYFDEDTIYLQYYESKLFGEPGNNDHFKVKPVLAKIGPDMEIIWKKKLLDLWGEGAGKYIQRIRKVNDTSFITGYTHLHVFSGTPQNLPFYYTNTVRLHNFTSSGDYNWIRDYYYYPIDSVKDPSYEINDIEIMPDGGYVLGGQVKNSDFINQGKPGQFAYLLRTNCLGFLSPPEAALSYESEENEVLFVNKSMSGGSYTYYFGDGDSLITGENVDSVMHTYENEGEYEVTLIAQGCNGEADTVKLQITVEIEEESTGAVGDGVFAIYPNPVTQGELLTVETGNIENSTLYFYDMNGKFLEEVFLPAAKSMYFIEHNFTGGVYVAKLVREGSVLAKRRFVVN